jgi:hypothetical protein
MTMAVLAGASGGGGLFASTSYVGNGGTKSITTGQNLAAGALTWIRKTIATSGNNRGIACQDTVRGVTKGHNINGNDAEITISTWITAFNGNGVSIGNEAYVNQSGDGYQIFSWLEQAGYMDIVTYSGNSTNRTVAHNLGAAFKFGIFKSRSALGKWIVYHDSIGATKYLTLNETTAAVTDSQQFQNTAPTSSVFSLGTSGDVNDAAATYIAYLFAEKAGSSKFGSYVGNGGSKVVTGLGFTPKMVMVKQTDGSNSWWMAYKDGGNVYTIEVNGSGSRSGGLFASLDSDGFTLSASSFVNASSGTYIYAAWG